jgi:hypothetical protein
MPKDQKHVCLSIEDVDTGAQLVAGFTSPLDPDEASRIRYAVRTAYTLI